MRLTFPTIAVAAATFAATLAFAPAIADAAQHLNLRQFLTLTAPQKASVEVVKQKPNCKSALGAIVDALRDKDCI